MEPTNKEEKKLVVPLEESKELYAKVKDILLRILKDDIPTSSVLLHVIQEELTPKQASILAMKYIEGEFDRKVQETFSMMRGMKSAMRESPKDSTPSKKHIDDTDDVSKAYI